MTLNPSTSRFFRILDRAQPSVGERKYDDPGDDQQHKHRVLRRSELSCMSLYSRNNVSPAESVRQTHYSPIYHFAVLPGRQVKRPASDRSANIPNNVRPKASLPQLSTAVAIAVVTSLCESYHLN